MFFAPSSGANRTTIDRFSLRLRIPGGYAGPIAVAVAVAVVVAVAVAVAVVVGSSPHPTTPITAANTSRLLIDP
jgi:hypothetical protein